MNTQKTDNGTLLKSTDLFSIGDTVSYEYFLYAYSYPEWIRATGKILRFSEFGDRAEIVFPNGNSEWRNISNLTLENT